MDPTKFPPWLRLAVPITALMLIVYEAVGYQGEPRYWLLVVYTAMLGIPSLLVSDARRGGADGKPQPPLDPQPHAETDPQSPPKVEP